MTRAIFPVVFTICLAILSPTASAAERRDLENSKESTQKIDSIATVNDLIRVTGRVIYDPRTGETRYVEDTSKPSAGSRGGNTDSGESPEETVEILPFDLFFADDDGTSTLNSYFLSQLSMGVYGKADTEEGFRDEMIALFEPQGIKSWNIHVKMDHDSGSEVAVFDIGDATVIAFRGTSGEGTTNPGVDQEVDLLDVPLKLKLNEKECRIHQGFWDSTDAVYDWVFDQALSAHISGQKIFLTGHSLGAAKATVAAVRLHYEDGIPVQSLQTFGSPKVGDKDFRSLCADIGTDGVKLAEVTQRFVVLGDPATTFPEKEAIGFNLLGPIWVFYHHVGITHTIHPLNADSSTFEIWFDSGEIGFTPYPWQWAAFLTGKGDSEHMWYDDALLEEVVDDPTLIEFKDLIVEHASVVQLDPEP